MRRPIALAAALALAFMTSAASAQDEAPVSTVEIPLQECLEVVHGMQADPDATERPGGRECIGIGSEACQAQPGGDTTLGTTQCNVAEQEFWDGLRIYYVETLEADLEPEVFASLQAAQQAFEQWRDAKCAFTYDLWKDGTISQIVHSSCRLQASAEWALELGDVLTELQPR
jgi:uncharacterized protein YecT (DUF1311 family)